MKYITACAFTNYNKWPSTHLKINSVDVNLSLSTPSREQFNAQRRGVWDAARIYFCNNEGTTGISPSMFISFG